MTAFNVTTAAQLAVAVRVSDFIHIYNNSDVTIYAAYDGATATVAAGMPIDVGATLQLSNDGAKPIFTRGVSLIHNGVGNKEVRIQQG